MNIVVSFGFLFVEYCFVSLFSGNYLAEIGIKAHAAQP